MTAVIFNLLGCELAEDGDRQKHAAARSDEIDINPLNAELNPICHLLALLGAHHIFHVSRVRVNIICVFVGTNRFQYTIRCTKRATKTADLTVSIMNAPSGHKMSNCVTG